VLTQYKSASLEEHIARAWHLSPMLDSYIETIPAQQRTGTLLVQGLGRRRLPDAARDHGRVPEYVVIFGGDHVYKMDVRRDARAAPRDGRRGDRRGHPRDESRRPAQFGVIESAADGQHPRLPREGANPPTMPGRDDMCLASMGNYIFKTQSLLDALERDASLETSMHDFGRDIIPRPWSPQGNVLRLRFSEEPGPGRGPRGLRLLARHRHDRRLLVEAQMDLVATQPAFNLYNGRWPIRTGYEPRSAGEVRVPRRGERARRRRDREPRLARLHHLRRPHHRSVLSARCPRELVQHIEESVLFENVVIGRHARIRRAIIDKDVEIPAGTQIGFNLEADRKRWFVSEGGIVVIPKRAKLPESGSIPPPPG
jgi:glucose-1-phosphate adenylyltransferase